MSQSALADCPPLDTIELDAPIAATEAAEPPPPTKYLTPCPSTFANYQMCPTATSVIIHSTVYNRLILWPVTCKRWGCSYCAGRKIRKLAFLAHNAAPNRWIRLGVNPALHASPEAAWKFSSPKVPELCRKLKAQIGECEYLRVCEIHNGTTKYAELQEPGKALGYPHYHALLRSNYLPQKLLSQIWGDLTGAPVVWIAKIDNSFSSFRYLAKYLTKLHRLEWTNRHVSYSRNFFRPEDLEKIQRAIDPIIERSDVHPWKLMTDRYGWHEIGVNNDGSFMLPLNKTPGQRDTPIEDFKLTAIVPPPPQTAAKQMDLPGLGVPDW